MYEIWGFLQDGVISHKISGSDLRVVGIQVYCSCISCMATGGAIGKPKKLQTTAKLINCKGKL